jgi:hypothetical protein
MRTIFTVEFLTLLEHTLAFLGTKIKVSCKTVGKEANSMRTLPQKGLQILNIAGLELIKSR